MPARSRSMAGGLRVGSPRSSPKQYTLHEGECVHQSRKVACKRCHGNDHVYRITTWPTGDSRYPGIVAYWCALCSRDAQRTPIPIGPGVVHTW